MNVNGSFSDCWTLAVKLYMNSIMVNTPGPKGWGRNGTSSIVNTTDVALLITIIMHNLGHIILWLLSREQAFSVLHPTDLLTGLTEPLRILCIITALCPFSTCWKVLFFFCHCYLFRGQALGFYKCLLTILTVTEAEWWIYSHLVNYSGSDTKLS